MKKIMKAAFVSCLLLGITFVACKSTKGEYHNAVEPTETVEVPIDPNNPDANAK